MQTSNTPPWILIPTPKTGWREPIRAYDPLLKRPKGHAHKPQEELLVERPAERVGAGIPPKGGSSLGEDPAPVEGEVRGQGLDARGRRRSGRVGVASRGAGLTGGFGGGDGDEARTSDVGELDDDELLVGEERESEDEDQMTISVGEASSSTGPYSSRTCIHKANTLREGTETISPHPTDATKAIVTYRYTDAGGGLFVQETEMPEVVPGRASASNEPGSIIVPDVETSKIPRTKKGSPWVPVPGTSHHEWTRGSGEQQETWRVVVFFRRLNRDTHAYQDIYINTNMLHRVNPNNRPFRTAYNKWMLQFARRRDALYTQKVARVHWSVAERRALCTAINAFCARFGVDRFGCTEDCKLSTAQLKRMADAVNAVPNPLRVAPRGVDAVRGQIISAHDKAQPKNKAVFDLLARAAALRARVAGGEAVSRAERKPQLAIALAEFPVEPPAAAAPSTPGGRKRKHTASVQDSDEEPLSLERSSLAVSEVGSGGVGGDNVSSDGAGEDNHSNNSAAADPRTTTNEEQPPQEHESAYWSDTTTSTASSEAEGQWAVEVPSSPRAKKARTAKSQD